MKRGAKPVSLRRQALLGTTALLLIAGSVALAPAEAGFSEGTAAYEAGDYTRAYNEWLPLARGGNAAAQRNIGQLYRLGLGVPKDLQVAANWYRLAADQGLARAQANLGVMYLRGEGVARDPETAAAWFRKAADQGHVISQYNLALMFEQGYGVARNRAEAAKWFSRAADGGHDKAGDRLASLLSESVAPAAGDTARPAPAQPVQTARSEEYLPPRVLNRGRSVPQPAPAQTEAPAPRPQPQAETQVASNTPTTKPEQAGRRDRLTEALTAPPSPANLAGTPAARFAVRPEPAPEQRVAQLPESAPETRGLSQPAFLRPERQAAREDKPVDVALSNAPTRAADPRPAPVASAPKPIIEVPVAPFLKAEAQTPQKEASPQTAIETPVAPFLAAEAAAEEKAPRRPAAPVAPVQVAAITTPPNPVPEPPTRPTEKTALVLPPAKETRPVPDFLRREAMGPPPGLGLEKRFGPNSYRAPHEVPVALRLDGVSVLPPDSPQTPPATVALSEDVPPPQPQAPETPAFLVREARVPQPEAPPPPAKRTPVQVAALPAVPRPDATAASQTEETGSPFGTRIPLFYVRQAEVLAKTAADDSTQVAALSAAPKSAVVDPVPVPAFIKEEAAGPSSETRVDRVAAIVGDDQAPAFLRREALNDGEDAPADKPTPAFLIAEAKLPDDPVPVAGPADGDTTALAIESEDEPPMRVARAAPAFLADEARQAPVPELLRREAAKQPADDDQDDVPPARTAALADRPVALPAAAPIPAAPPSEVPEFLRAEAQTGALALVDTPRAGDPVGRAKRVTALLGSADEAARTNAPRTIPQYYRDRAALVAQTQATGTEPPPLPFLRRAPRTTAQAPIQPTPELLVAEARRDGAPVASFLREEAAQAAGSRTVPGTGQAPAETQVAVRNTERQPQPANQPRRYTETGEDRRVVNAGVAAYLSRDYDKALSFWMPAAERGNPDAQFFVGGLYLDGNGVARDLIAAHVWFARATAQGHARAREQIALLRKIMTQDQFAEAEARATR